MLLDLVEGIMRATPIWQYVRPQLVMQNLFGMLVLDAFNMSIGKSSYSVLIFKFQRGQGKVFKFSSGSEVAVFLQYLQMHVLYQFVAYMNILGSGHF